MALPHDSRIAIPFPPSDLTGTDVDLCCLMLFGQSRGWSHDLEDQILQPHPATAAERQ